jgi:hypothetical protein
MIIFDSLVEHEVYERKKLRHAAMKKLTEAELEALGLDPMAE